MESSVTGSVDVSFSSPFGSFISVSFSFGTATKSSVITSVEVSTGASVIASVGVSTGASVSSSTGSSVEDWKGSASEVCCSDSIDCFVISVSAADTVLEIKLKTITDTKIAVNLF